MLSFVQYISIAEQTLITNITFGNGWKDRMKNHL